MPVRFLNQRQLSFPACEIFHFNAEMFHDFLYCRTLSNTALSCGIVAGEIAIVLEKFPRYTPQQVKEDLIDQSTPG